MKRVLSIVIPVYNTFDTLGRLLDTIPYKNNEEVEVIIVDDGSTDGGAEKLKKMKQAENFKILFFEKNKGLSCARNAGIEASSGEYITFADSDDYYCDDFLDFVLPVIKKNKSDLIIFDYYWVFEDRIETARNFENEILNFNENEYLKGYLRGELVYKFGTSQNHKIYKNCIIKENEFRCVPGIRPGEDLLFNILYSSKVREVNIRSERIFNYIRGHYKKYWTEGFTSNFLQMCIYIDNLCDTVSFKEKNRYFALFALRRYLEVIRVESNNDNSKDAYKKVGKVIKSAQMKKAVKNASIKDFDIKLLIAYLIYKFKLYYICLFILRFKRRVLGE